MVRSWAWRRSVAAARNRLAETHICTTWMRQASRDVHRAGEADPRVQRVRQRDQAACLVVPAMSATPDQELASASVRAEVPRHSPLIWASLSKCANAPGSLRWASDSIAACARLATSSVEARSMSFWFHCTGPRVGKFRQPVNPTPQVSVGCRRPTGRTQPSSGCLLPSPRTTVCVESGESKPRRHVEPGHR
jgi:hypothetical protein